MRNIKLLFKKDWIEFVSAFKQGKVKDVIGMFSSLCIVGIVYGFFVYVFGSFAKSYVATDFGNVILQKDRIIELMTLGFTLILFVNVLMGVKKIYGLLVDGKDNDVLVHQPIGTGEIYIYKLLKIYISQLLSTILITLPITIVLDRLSSSIGGVDYYLLISLVVVLLPFISCAIASIISIPYIHIVRKISSKFWLVLLVYVSIVGGGFLLYGYFLTALSEIIRSGEIKYVFDLQTINNIHDLVRMLYPGKFFTNILINNKPLLNVVCIVLISFVSTFISYMLIKRIYHKIIQTNLEGSGNMYRSKGKVKERSVTSALLHKEFTMVLRTPSYAFQYFAMAITLPFMVYVCTSLLETMVASLTIVECNYALAIFVVSMLSILTNTFCTTNISRDGRMFALMKTMPITVNKMVLVKVLFCSIVSFVSIFASSLVLLMTEFVTFSYFLVTFIVGFVFSLAQIAYATRKDMKNPCFPRNDKEEIVEGNSNMSTLVLVGLLTTIIAGGGSVLLSIILGMKYGETKAMYISLSFVFAIAISVGISAFLYLFKGLKKEYYIKE